MCASEAAPAMRAPTVTPAGRAAVPRPDETRPSRPGQSPPAGLMVIGVAHSTYTSRETTPVQSSLNRSAVGIIEFDHGLAPALEGLDGFDYAWLITWLGRPEDPAAADLPLRQVPFLLRRAPREVGVLATRGPRRFNPIGLSLVRILEVGEATVRFAGVDVVDGTPVIDIKPFVAQFDRPPGTVESGWFDTVDLAEGSTPASLEPTSETAAPERPPERSP